jgi:hypothetical protein
MCPKAGPPKFSSNTDARRLSDRESGGISNGNPMFATVAKVLKALGLRLSVVA